MHSRSAAFAGIAMALILASMAAISAPNPAFTGNAVSRGKPLAVWYVVPKWVIWDNEEDYFFSLAEKYRPDAVILTIYAEDDIVPFHVRYPGKLAEYTKRLKSIGISVYYGYSLFSRSAHEEIKGSGLREEDYSHISDFARYIREYRPEEYGRYFSYYTDRGIDPEEIPKALRKPVDGYYVAIGAYTAIDPLYEPYRRFIREVINETVSIERPDGIALDHIRFFIFDSGYNQDIRDFILGRSGFDIYNFTPRPFKKLDKSDWAREDALYFDSRAAVINFSVSDITRDFQQFELLGTSMGHMIPAISNGQYAAHQGEAFGKILLMAYDRDPAEVARNVNDTLSLSGRPVILGLSNIFEESVSLRNIDAALAAGASGIYLLGYKFPESVHEKLMKIRGLP